MAVARSAGWRYKPLSYLGFRAVALHPRLHSAARLRGLRARQNVGKVNRKGRPYTMVVYLSDLPPCRSYKLKTKPYSCSSSRRAAAPLK
jgi:hypothetical protein